MSVAASLSTGRKCTLVVVLRGEVGGVYFGKVHSAKFPWTRGKKEDDEMMFTNHATHAPGTKLSAPTSTRRRSNTADVVSDWQQDAEANPLMGGHGGLRWRLLWLLL